ncbi:ABC transporter related protein [Magnetococcus marinus MC-1]|uniref:ABC transporter related protein n=1 Tax=Magnetococcus marinus (strain ATCC BAA-1437 / JCM 17883 / MC-1) TaxID=156889 RepID=A0L6B4_MAGMM|nr:ABC transporter ATP-binding protein [Magnetococcus marinus]ABK43507.1 ABC transporter related protein [Magnetococcus marinus MC-1]
MQNDAKIVKLSPNSEAPHAAPVPLIRLQGVCKQYGALSALQGVNLTVARGEVVGFLGPNGAGKTTTMSILAGLLAPTEGVVQVAGVDMLRHPQQAKPHIGFLPEQPPLYKEMTVQAYLSHLARLRGVAARQCREAVSQVMAQCGLNPVAGRVLGHLSKGYQQRAGIAQALVHRPEVVILDEPTSGLDPLQIQEICLLIRSLGQQHAVLLSTHILSEVRMTCDRVVLIHQGKIQLDTSMADLEQHLQAPQVVQVSLANDPGQAVLAALPGVAHVEACAGGWRITPQQDADPVPALLAAAVAQHWGLRQLQPQQAPLESLFTALAQTDQEELR